MSIKLLTIDLFPGTLDGFQVARRLSSARYKKPKSPKAPPKPKLSETGKIWEDRTYDAYERMMNGGGFTGLEDQQLNEILASSKKGYLYAAKGLESDLSRSVRSGDERVLNASRNMLEQGYHGQVQEAKEATLYEKASAQEQGLDMGVDALANAKQMSASITGMYNQYAQQQSANQQQYGTFGSQLAQGLGAAGGWLSAAQRYGQGMSGTQQVVPAAQQSVPQMNMDFSWNSMGYR